MKIIGRYLQERFQRVAVTNSARHRVFVSPWLISAGFLFCLFVELFSGEQANGIFISQAHAYKVERVCETTTSKKGPVEKCRTKLVTENKSQDGNVKPAAAKDQKAPKK